MAYFESKDIRTGVAVKHSENAKKGKGNDLSNVEVKPGRVHLDPDNYDRNIIENMWDPILERHGWEITDITDDDYDEIIITLESQDASGTTTIEDLESNTKFIETLEDTGAFQDIIVNINDSAYISLECSLYPEIE